MSRSDFPTTPWSLIREAAITGSAESRDALSSLCELYWYPLYVYLLAALKHFLSDLRDREAAVKRGGGKALLSLDLEEGERRWAQDPRSSSTHEHIFERKWALTLLAHVLREFEAEQQRSNKPEVVGCLSAFLPGARHSMSYHEAAERTGLTLSAVKVTVHRMRKRYRQILRREVLRTIDSPDEVEAELRFLL